MDPSKPYAQPKASKYARLDEPMTTRSSTRKKSATDAPAIGEGSSDFALEPSKMADAGTNSRLSRVSENQKAFQEASLKSNVFDEAQAKRPAIGAGSSEFPVEPSNDSSSPSGRQRKVSRNVEDKTKPIISAGSGEFPMDPTEKETSKSQPASSSPTIPTSSGDEKTLKATTATTTTTKSQGHYGKLVEVMVCGWPEKSASLVAKECLKANFRVVPFGVALQEENGVTFQPQIQVKEMDNLPIDLIPGSRTDVLKEKISTLVQNPSRLIVVDTAPDATKRVHVYAELGLSFVIRSATAMDVISSIRKIQKAPAVILERTSPALTVFDEALLQVSEKLSGIMKDYKVDLRRSSATLDPLLSNKLTDALGNLTARKVDAQQLQEEASKHPIPTKSETVEELSFENECSIVKLTCIRKEKADDEEFANMAMKAVQFLYGKLLEEEQQVVKNGAGVYGVMDILAQPQPPLHHHHHRLEPTIHQA